MKILIACEYSGVVREAFAEQGHDVWSCDLLDSDIPGQHIKGDVLEILNQGWDMMIAHPPCTDLAVSGAAWFKEKIADGRQKKALDFVRALMDAPIRHIAIENPVSVISTYIRKPDQIIQPYMFGHMEQKKTCLWLKNLPSNFSVAFAPERTEGSNPSMYLFTTARVPSQSLSNIVLIFFIFFISLIPLRG